MPAKKVYYSHPYLRVLETELVSSKTDEGGSWYSFAETLFYPEGGGQTSDRGWINSFDLLDVQLSEGEIWHLVNAPISGRVSMRLDWPYRYANMQQHTGQHILSACFKQLYNLDTTSVHLGSDITMIELNTSEIEESILENTEISANEMIRENIPVETIEINRDKLDKYALRRSIKTKNDLVRLVRIGDVDCVGCGGIHVRSTAEIGLIKIIGVEKIRGHIRIKIKIGSSAYHYFRLLHRTIQNVSTHLTTSVEDLPDRIESLQAEKRDLIGDIKKINKRLLSEIAKNLKTQEETGCFAFRDLSHEQLKILSEHYLKINKKPCLFTSEDGGRIHFFIRLPNSLNKNVQDFIQQHKEPYSLKGGGSRDFANGQIECSGTAKFSSKNLFKSFNDFVNDSGTR
jgi:alanyl-tRNA synthetase